MFTRRCCLFTGREKKQRCLLGMFFAEKPVNEVEKAAVAAAEENKKMYQNKAKKNGKREEKDPLNNPREMITIRTMFIIP